MKQIILIFILFSVALNPWGQKIIKKNLTFVVTSYKIPYTVKVFASEYKANNVIIPEMVKFHGIKYKVTEIGDGAFANRKYLKSVKFPNSFISIGAETFYFCKSLTTISVPQNIKIIGGAAFENCWFMQNITCANICTGIIAETTFTSVYNTCESCFG